MKNSFPCKCGHTRNAHGQNLDISIKYKTCDECYMLYLEKGIVESSDPQNPFHNFKADNLKYLEEMQRHKSSEIPCECSHPERLHKVASGQCSICPSGDVFKVDNLLYLENLSEE